MAATANGVRAGRAFVELFADDTRLQATLKQAQTRLRAFADGATALGTASLAGGTAILAPLGLATKAASDFESVMADLRGTLNATDADMAKIRGSVIDVAGRTATDPSRVAASYLELVKAGLDLQTVMGGAGEETLKFARVAGVDAAFAAIFLTDALNVFAAENLSAASATTTVSRAADASSISIEEMTQSFASGSAVAAAAGQTFGDFAIAVGLLGNAGIKGQDAGTSLKTFFLRLMAPSREGAAAVEQLGLNVRDAAGNMLPLREILAELESKLGSLDAASRDTALREIFGTDAIRAAVTLLREGSGGYDEFRGKLQDMLPVGSKFAIMMATLSGQTSAARTSVALLAETIGGQLLKPLGDGLDVLTRYARGLRGIAQENQTLAPTLIKTAAAMVGVGVALKGIAVGVGVTRGITAAVAAISTFVVGASKPSPVETTNTSATTANTTAAKANAAATAAKATAANRSASATSANTSAITANTSATTANTSAVGPNTTGLTAHAAAANADAVAVRGRTASVAADTAATAANTTTRAASATAATTGTAATSGMTTAIVTQTAASRAATTALAGYAAALAVAGRANLLAGPATAVAGRKVVVSRVFDAGIGAAAGATATAAASKFAGITAAIKAIGAKLLGLGVAGKTAAAGLGAIALPLLKAVAITGALTLAVVGVVKLVERVGSAADEAERLDGIFGKLNKGDAGRAADRVDLDRLRQLDELARRQGLTNTQMAEASRLVETLTAKYGGFSATVDPTTGRVNGLADAMRRLNEQQREAAASDLRSAISERESQLAAVQARQNSAGGIFDLYGSPESMTAALKDLEAQAGSLMAALQADRARLDAIGRGDPDAIAGTGRFSPDPAVRSQAGQTRRGSTAADAARLEIMNEAADAVKNLGEIEAAEHQRRMTNTERELAAIRAYEGERRGLLEAMIRQEETRPASDGGPDQAELQRLRERLAQNEAYARGLEADIAARSEREASSRMLDLRRQGADARGDARLARELSAESFRSDQYDRLEALGLSPDRLREARKLIGQIADAMAAIPRAQAEDFALDLREQAARAAGRDGEAYSIAAERFQRQQEARIEELGLDAEAAGRARQLIDEIAAGMERVRDSQERMGTSGARGTFNPTAIRALQSTSAVAERTAKASEETARNTRDLRRRAEQPTPVFA